MGKIKKILALTELEERTVTSNATWTDMCENIHVHFRNLRIDFSELEFAHFRAFINGCGRAIEKVSLEKDYKEGDPNFLIQQMFNVPVSPNSDYYPDRLSIELQKDNTVHFHYRDIRLHWSLAEFRRIGSAFVSAYNKFLDQKQFSFEGQFKRTLAEVDIDEIQPWDEGHKPGVIDEEHREGIEFVKILIQEGEKIRPILVDSHGQRLDGFKRYMAFKELGYKKITCIIDPWAPMGGQHNQSFIDDNPELRRETNGKA